MIKARNQFIRYALCAVFVLLLVLLAVINGVNFTMAAQDADELTLRLCRSGEGEAFSGARAGMGKTGRPVRMGPMGPDSPEMAASLRFFTFAFDGEGNARRVDYSIAAVSEEEALSWARSLLGEGETGWTGGSYRYRVYEDASGQTLVTVIDQGRELLPSYRILAISGAGLVLCMLLSLLALRLIGRRLFQPLEEADRKQKLFIAEAEREFKVPLTVVSASTELLESAGGENEQTRAIHRQVRRMSALVKDLGALKVFDEEALSLTRFDLSSLAQAAADAARPQFEERHITFVMAPGDHIMVQGDCDALSDLMVELVENALKFSLSRAQITVTQRENRVVIEASNDTNLPAGSAEAVFDRFTRLENARDVPGSGLGLARVKDIARAHNARVSASVADGLFTLRINL